MMPKDGRPTAATRETRREPVKEPAPDPAQTKRTLTHYVDPYGVTTATAAQNAGKKENSRSKIAGGCCCCDLSPVTFGSLVNR
jgi:hypothetical protein